MTEFKGFDLFDDLDIPQDLRNRNRACVLSNIVEDNTKNKLITLKGAALATGYFAALPVEDRLDVSNRFNQIMEDRGYVQLV